MRAGSRYAEAFANVGATTHVAAWRKAAEPLKAKWASQVKDADVVFAELQAELKKRGALAE